MKHPNREDLMSFLYDELDREQRAEIEHHLNGCETCRGSVAGWRATARQLDAFQSSVPCRPATAWQPQVRWAVAAAAAAAILLGGFLIGRVTGISRTELETARRDAALQAISASRAETQQLLQQFAGSVKDRLDTLESQQSRDYASLRQELETVAVLTEASFRQTESRLGRLADNTATPVFPPAP